MESRRILNEVREHMHTGDEHRVAGRIPEAAACYSLARNIALIWIAQTAGHPDINTIKRLATECLRPTVRIPAVKDPYWR